MTEQNQASMWMSKLNNRIQTLVHNLGLPNDIGQSIKEFVFEVAKEQYRVGNSSGIRWARTNPDPRPAS
ncbi:hypothetical protein KJ673_00590 [Patescibacteria group bacterium]|nr:hypothetical protein [Patescibacteria group bacterium]MBU4452720.1 hypothetical protein [Patescibacteria group bacterium]